MTSDLRITTFVFVTTLGTRLAFSVDPCNNVNNNLSVPTP